MRYQVRLEPGGKTFTVADDETVLAAAIRQDIALPYGCQSGGCGACRARVVSGQIAYERAPHALSKHETAAGFALLCQARPSCDLVLAMEELPAGGPRVIRNLAVRLESVKRLGHDVMALHLRLPRGRGFAFRAGQYVDILFKDGRRRSFSIASPPSTEGTIELHVRRVAGGLFTDRVFAGLPDRTILRIEGPLGAFHLRESGRPVVMVAGGTGFAPIKSMLEDAFERGQQRPMHLYWGARALRDLYLANLPQAWAAAHVDFRYTPVLSEPAEEDRWEGRRGWVHTAVATDYPDMRGLDVYMSGPPAMVDTARDRFAELGLPADRLFYDSFDYAFETWPERG